MENKYYTPDISEFHVGFECEIRDNNKNFEWIKIECCPENLYDVQSSNYSARVKYLDKEDIESLDFIITEEQNKSYGYYLQGFIKHGINKTELWYAFLKNADTVYISLKNSHYNGNAKFYIKNKSELKKLLKQLNINNDDK